MNQVKLDLQGLFNIKKALSDNYKTRVGIIGDKAAVMHSNTNQTNASIGAVHELGSLSQNIPARSFIKIPLEIKVFEWIKKNRAGYKAMLEQGNLKNWYEKLGIAAESIIKEAFASSGFGKWKPLKKETIRRKGSDGILLDTGQLRDSISSRVVKK